MRQDERARSEPQLALWATAGKQFLTGALRLLEGGAFGVRSAFARVTMNLDLDTTAGDRRFDLDSVVAHALGEPLHGFFAFDLLLR